MTIALKRPKLGYNYIMKTITEQLIAEKELLSNPSRWTKGAIATNVDGFQALAQSDEAVCWCQLGASIKLRSSYTARVIKWQVANSRGFLNSMVFNDSVSTTHEKLMAFYDECIKEAERQG